jgi:gamma-glutamyl:cysteine ligase YbdK (ATP-grasp superfamily)
VFESVLNAEGSEKVRFPRDVDTVEEAVDRVAQDPSVVPMAVSGGDRYDDRFATLRRKHGTYWRWVRPVFDGPTRSSANARIEFRPIPAQPTVRDSTAFGAAFAGLMESLPRRAHPVEGLSWETAKENFYAAARDGFDADLTWITNAGDTTTHTTELYDDLLAHAADGLESAGCTEEEADYYIDPLRKRVETATTPAAWKRSDVRARLADGDSFETAVTGMQRRYVDRQKETLLEGCFTEWL